MPDCRCAASAELRARATPSPPAPPIRIAAVLATAGAARARAARARRCRARRARHQPNSAGENRVYLPKPELRAQWETSDVVIKDEGQGLLFRCPLCGARNYLERFEAEDGTVVYEQMAGRPYLGDVERRSPPRRSARCR
jgi:hypothetical protein